MAAVHDRKNPVRIFGRRLAILGLAALLVFLLATTWNVFKKERESAALRAEAETLYAHLSAQESRLRESIKTLGSERGKEEAVREQYDVGRKGEQLIVIVEPPAPEPVQATTTLLQRIQRAFSWW